MDRAEAIERLGRWLDTAEKYVDGFERTFPTMRSSWRGDVEAFEMAIAALREQEQKSPCSLCGYGGKHLDAPPCTRCPAYPKEGAEQETVTNRNGLTNADRIRDMTDEELAKWLYEFFWGRKGDVRLCVLGDWLKQLYGGVDHE